MAWQDILKKLQETMYGQPGQDVSAGDVQALQEGPQENRGVANIMGNIRRIGAGRRMAGKQLREGEEERVTGLDLKKAQAENLRSLGPYRTRMLDIREDLNEIKRLHESVYKAKSEADAQNAIQQLEVSRANSEAAMLSAEARMKSAVNEDERGVARLEFDREKFKQEQAQDAIKNAQRWADVRTSQGWLNIGQQKAPGEMARTSAETGYLGARTAGQEQATGQAEAEAPVELATKEAQGIEAGQKAGVLSPSAGEKAQTSIGETFGLGPIEPGAFTKLMRFVNPAAPMQESTVIPGAPRKPAAPSRPRAVVRPKATGSVTVVGPGGEVREGPAANIAAFLAANPRWKRE